MADEKQRNDEMNETKHTPTPWKCVDGDIGNETTKEGVVFHEGIYGKTVEQAEANAAHIVRCVNAHDGLVRALRTIADVACGERQCKSEAICSLRAAGIEVAP